MPQAVKISTNVISGSINKNGVSFNIEGAGRDFSTLDGGGWVSSVLPDDGRWVIVSESQGSGIPAFWLTAGDSNSDLLTTVNGLPSRYDLSDFTATGSALDYLVTNDYMVLRAVPEQSDADAVRLNLDSNNLSSYPRQGTTWGDVSGEGLDTTLNNSPVFNGGWFEFDGVDDNAQGTDGGKLDFGTGDFTLEAMVNLTSLSSGVYKTPFSRGDTTSGNATWWAFQKTNSNYWDFVVDDNNTKREAIWASTVQERKWYHLMGVRDAGNQLTLYVDGIERATQVDNGGSVSQASGYRTFRVGAQQGVLTLSEHFPGKIEKVKVYGSALSEDDVKQNYFGGPIVTDKLVFALDGANLVSYESGSLTAYNLQQSSSQAIAYSGSLVNGMRFDTANGGCWKGDGIDENITFAESNISKDPSLFLGDTTGNLTYECWVYRDGTSANADPRIMSTDASDYTAIYIQSSGAGNIIFSTNVNGQGMSSSGPNPPVEEWTHIVGTFSYDPLGGTNNALNLLYVNGVNVGSNTQTRTGNYGDGTTRPFAIFSNVESTVQNNNCFNGKIAVSRIYGKALSQEEILQNYNAQKQRFQK